VPNEVKSDAVLPAYCNPPNPCPVGHTADDGCLEIFENTAAFSRAYQASQDCMCDTEHMFDCHASSSSQEADDESDLNIGQSPFLSELQVCVCVCMLLLNLASSSLLIDTYISVVDNIKQEFLPVLNDS